jgi:alkyl hydroperoxide reductase subunit AhpC
MSSSLVTKQAPDFTATAVLANGTFNENFSLSDFQGKYVVLFFYPLDFTFVCPTEIIAFDRKIDEFEKRGVQVIGASVDSHFSHFAWRNTDRKEGGIGQVRYPLVADITKQISAEYGVLHESGVALRGLFLIDKEGIVRHQVVNDLPLGRSIEEALRMVDALRTFETDGEVCPADFHKGDATMQADQEGLKKFAGENF